MDADPASADKGGLSASTSEAPASDTASDGIEKVQMLMSAVARAPPLRAPPL